MKFTQQRVHEKESNSTFWAINPIPLNTEVTPKCTETNLILPRSTEVRHLSMSSPRGRGIIIIITLFKSLVIQAEHECSSSWGDCKPNKSNQMNESNKSNQIKLIVGF